MDTLPKGKNEDLGERSGFAPRGSLLFSSIFPPQIKNQSSQKAQKKRSFPSVPAFLWVSYLPEHLKMFNCTMQRDGRIFPALVRPCLSTGSSLGLLRAVLQGSKPHYRHLKVPSSLNYSPIPFMVTSG